MRCARCGTENPSGRITCRACGARLRPSPAGSGTAGAGRIESDEELRRRLRYDLLRIVWVIAAVIIVGAGLGILLK